MNDAFLSLKSKLIVGKSWLCLVFEYFCLLFSEEIERAN